MVTVALVGATSGLGRTVLLTFIEQNKDNKHKLVLLSRTEQPGFAAQGVDVRPVDYQSHEQLVTALRGVHTALSFVGGSAEVLKDSQLALISACKEAGVKRFAPSEYAANSYEGVDLYAAKIPVWEATKKSGLEYTRFSCGLFMNLFATGTPKPLTEAGESEGRKSGEEEALAGVRPWNYVVNVRAGTADFAGDGTAAMCLTEMHDIGCFVFRALDMEKWPEDLGMRGDVKSFREITEICEKVQGRKFLIKETSLEEVAAMAEDPGKRFYNQTRLALLRGWGMVGDELNRDFPDIKPIACEGYIQKWWGGVELGKPRWEEDKVFDSSNMN